MSYKLGIPIEEYIDNLAKEYDDGKPIYFENHLPENPEVDALLITADGQITRAKIIPYGTGTQSVPLKDGSDPVADGRSW
jgi:hypothetical protein